MRIVALQGPAVMPNAYQHTVRHTGDNPWESTWSPEQDEMLEFENGRELVPVGVLAQPSRREKSRRAELKAPKDLADRRIAYPIDLSLANVTKAAQAAQDRVIGYQTDKVPYTLKDLLLEIAKEQPKQLKRPQLVDLTSYPDSLEGPASAYGIDRNSLTDRLSQSLKTRDGNRVVPAQILDEFDIARAKGLLYTLDKNWLGVPTEVTTALKK